MVSIASEFLGMVATLTLLPGVAIPGDYVPENFPELIVPFQCLAIPLSNDIKWQVVKFLYCVSMLQSTVIVLCLLSSTGSVFGM